MKTTLLFCLIALTAIAIKPIPAKQKTTAGKFTTLLSPPSYTLPDPLPSYGGTYEPISAAHFYYDNYGQIRYDDVTHSPAAEVKYYTQFTFPRKLILENNNVAFVTAKSDTSQNNILNDTLHRVDLEYLGKNSGIFSTPCDTQNTAVLNYFLASCGTITNVAGHGAIVTQTLYPNIDLVYSSNDAGMRIFFVVYPGGNPGDITLKFTGAKSTSYASGKLSINTNFDSFSFEEAEAYNVYVSGSSVSTATTSGSGWISMGGDTYKISPGAFDPSAPLIILAKQGAALQAGGTHKNIDWSTYLGGSDDDAILSSHCDAANNLYVAGKTKSNNFPQAVGATGFSVIINGLDYDGFAAKFDTARKARWFTFIGGTKADVITDFDFSNTDVYLIGDTYSSDLPIQPKSGAYNKSNFVFAQTTSTNVTSYYQDAFIFQLDTGGIIPKWCSYYGGNFEDAFTCCKFDANGNFFIGGYSNSSNLPVVASSTAVYSQYYDTLQWNQSLAPPHYNKEEAFDGYILKLGPGSNTVWASYYGSTASKDPTHNVKSHDYFSSLDIMPGNDNLYLAGSSNGSSLPSSLNARYNSSTADGIAVTFSNNGHFIDAIYTNGNIDNYAIKCDPNTNNILLCGKADANMNAVITGSGYIQTTCQGNLDGCYLRYTNNLNTCNQAVFMGSIGDDVAVGMVLGSGGLVYILGHTEYQFPTHSQLSSNYTHTYNYGTAGLLTSLDYFLFTMLNNDTGIQVSSRWSTCLGTVNDESEYYNNALGTYHRGSSASICADANNHLFICGNTDSQTNFPFEDGGGFPAFSHSVSASSQIGTFDATITRFDVSGVNIAYGIAEHKAKANNLILFPNPSLQTISFKNEEIKNKNASYKVYNVAGALQMQGKLNDEAAIDVSKLSAGIYFIILMDELNIRNAKFIKSNE